MKKGTIWQILGITETKNHDLIKEAYRKQLVLTNPEDDAQGFINLRNAYEEAMRLSTDPESDEEKRKDKNDIDLWIDNVDDIYQNINKRLSIRFWKELLEADVCKGLDTWLEAREKFLAYLMNHYYLPPDAWILFDREFDIVKDKENLLQSFPEDFIEYAIRQIQNYSLMDLNLLSVSENDDVDDYIRTYYSIKRMMDENNTENLHDELNKIDMQHIYHPYVDVEKLRYFVSINNEGKIKNLIHKLSSYLEDDYIAFYVSKAHWAVNNHDEAAAIWEELCGKFPTHYGALLGLIEYCIYKGQYKEANERAVNLSRIYSRDEEVHNLLVKANEHLIKEYEEECKTEPGNLKVMEELAWCYYQNSYPDKCLQLLDGFPQEAKQELWYFKLYGYVHFRKGEFKKALECFYKWLELLNNSPEAEEHRRNLCICNHMIGLCCINEEDYESAIPYLNEAVSIEENPAEKLHIMERLSFAYLKSERNEDCIDVCDEIIKQSKDYYPSYINRQEAYFNMQNGQGVIDDYHSAVEIYAGYIKPYLLAVKVYYFYGQHDDSIGVITKAKEANLNSNELELFLGKNLRILAQTKEESEAALKVLKDLHENVYNGIKSLDDNDNNEDEYNDLGEILYEIARTYADIGQFEEGLEAIKEAIEVNPRDNYYTTKAYLYMDLELWVHATEILEKQVDKFPDFEYIHVCLARCYEKKDREQDALRLYKKVLDINPENIEALEKIGDIYLNLYKREENTNHYKTAISYGERLLELKKDSCYYYIHIGIMYERGYEFEKALQCCQKASECDPEDIWPHNNAGYVYKIMKRYDDAIREYQKAIELMKPGQAIQPHSNLATCYEILGRYDEALDCCHEILKHWPDRQSIHEDVASLLTKMRKYKEAADVYLDMIKKYNYPREEAYYSIMEIYAEAGDFGNASKYAGKAVKSNNTEVVLRRVGRYYFSIGKYLKAENFLMAALKKIKSKNTLQYCLYALDLAELYFDEGKTHKAKHWATESLAAIKNASGSEKEYVSYKPHSGIRNYRLGMIHMILGDLEKSEYHFTEAIENPPCNTCGTKVCFEGFYGLGRLYEEMKLFNRADEYYHMAIEESNDALYRRHLLEIKNKENNIKDTIFKRIWRYL